jgi:hypothetical protein
MSGETWRRDALGSSDAPALVGVDPFRTAGDVWAEKTGRYQPPPTPESVDARQLGDVLEPLLLGAVERRLRLPRPTARRLFYRHPELPLAASVDGLALDREPPLLIEAKTAGLLGPSPLLAAYGDDRTDEVPDSVVVQVHHQLAVLDAQPELARRIGVAVVPALLGGRGFRCYVVPREQALVDELAALEADWWARYVVADVCPPAEPPSLGVLKTFRRRADAPVVLLDEQTVGDWLAARDALRAAETAEETAKRRIILALGDGELGACSLGRVSYKASARSEYTVAAQTVRALRFSPAKRAGKGA